MKFETGEWKRESDGMPPVGGCQLTKAQEIGRLAWAYELSLAFASPGSTSYCSELVVVTPNVHRT